MNLTAYQFYVDACTDCLPPPPLPDTQILLASKHHPVKQQRTDILLARGLRQGYILTDLTKTGVTGSPGVGKSHLRYFFIDETPPLIRCSTACIEQAERILVSSYGPEGKETVTFKIVGTEKMVTMVAEGINAGMTLSEGSGQVVKLQDGGQNVVPVRVHVDTDRTGDIPTPLPSSPHSESVNQPTLERKETITLQGGSLRQDLLPQTAEIAKLLPKLSGSKQLLHAHFCLFIDCGGQANFLEILPAFLRNLSLQLLVFKLPEKLSQPPVVDYHKPDGTSYQLGHFVLSNEQLLTQCAQMARSQRHQISTPYVERQPESTKIMVIGTFKDHEHECSETREEKNGRLRQAFRQFHDLLIPRSEKEVIYPVNATLAGPGRDKDPVAAELRQVIHSCGQSLRVKFPVALYLLELELRRIGRGTISWDQCWDIARQLHFESKEALDTALNFYHELNLFLYYPDVLKNTVFVDPMSLLDKLTQLFESHIELKDATDDQIQSDELLRYRNEALITRGVLKEFTHGYQEGLFTLEDLIRLLEHLLIVAAIPNGGDSALFMPSLLEQQEDDEIVRPKSGVSVPLLVDFPSKCAPIGAFCAFMVSLLSSKGHLTWSVPQLEGTVSTTLYRNVITVSVASNDVFSPDESDCSTAVTLVNSQAYYEVHVDSEYPSDILPLIREDIDRGLQNACSTLSYKVTHQIAFHCSCLLPDPHPAFLSDDRTSLVCTENKGVTISLAEKQKLWLLAPPKEGW